MSTFYEWRMSNLLSCYGISENGQKMLKAFEDFKTSRIDEAELGRLVRLSPNNRSSLINTMVKCAGIMGKKPEESKHCLAMISACAETIEIADKPPRIDGFPSFKKLPRELRGRIYDKYLDNDDPKTDLITYKKRGTCICPDHEPPLSCSRYWKKNISLAFVSKDISNEFLTSFYGKKMIHFSCACEMGYRLTTNPILQATVRNVKFHWRGADADKGISILGKIKQLETLVVVISKPTTKYVTRREQELRKFFYAKRLNTLTDALGVDELLAMRGLTSVRVEHVHKRQADRRSDDEKGSLSALLQFKLKQAREDDDESE